MNRIFFTHTHIFIFILHLRLHFVVLRLLHFVVLRLRCNDLISPPCRRRRRVVAIEAAERLIGADVGRRFRRRGVARIEAVESRRRQRCGVWERLKYCSEFATQQTQTGVEYRNLVFDTVVATRRTMAEMVVAGTLLWLLHNKT